MTRQTRKQRPTTGPTPGRSQRLGTTGRWRVTTGTSTYLLDLDAGVATRSPTRGAAAGVPAMRRDHEPVRLHSVALAEVGEPLVLVLDGGGNGVLTLRRSTPVREIVGVPPPAGGAVRAASWRSHLRGRAVTG